MAKCAFPVRSWVLTKGPRPRLQVNEPGTSYNHCIDGMNRLSGIPVRATLLVTALLAAFTANGEDIGDADLARMLAHTRSRDGAVASLVASGKGKIPILLSWADKPPVGINDYELDIGLAVAFGRMRVKEAIPFLIKNIGLNTFPFTDVWTRTPTAIEERLPAVLALIQIGPEASRAVIDAYPKYTAGMDRLAAIFVVSRIPGVPDARAFLVGVLGQSNQEHYHAEEGLRFLDRGGHAPAQ